MASISEIKNILADYIDTLCPRTSDVFYVVTYNIKWVTTSWTHSIYIHSSLVPVYIIYNKSDHNYAIKIEQDFLDMQYKE